MQVKLFIGFLNQFHKLKKMLLISQNFGFTDLFKNTIFVKLFHQFENKNEQIPGNKKSKQIVYLNFFFYVFL